MAIIKFNQQDSDDKFSTCLMPFGKHKGKSLRWIADNDVLYLDWLVGIELRGELSTLVPELCREYSTEILDAIADEEDLRDAVSGFDDD